MSNIMMTFRYQDPARAIAFLKAAFGFTEHAVHKEGDEIVHAELVLGTSMIMLGKARDDEFGKLQGLPNEVGGRLTSSPYVVIEDTDAHHDRAVTAGAKVVMPLADRPYGSREYSCLDLEGQLWNFGTYDPWKTQG